MDYKAVLATQGISNAQAESFASVMGDDWVEAVENSTTREEIMSQYEKVLNYLADQKATVAEHDDVTLLPSDEGGVIPSD